MDPVDDATSFALRLEEAVWRALETGDRAADERLLADDFLGVYPTGTTDRAGHVEQFVDGPSVHEHRIESASTIRITDDHLLLTYLAHYRRSADGPAEHMWVSSLWSRRGDDWVNVFSQDTPTT